MLRASLLSSVLALSALSVTVGCSEPLEEDTRKGSSSQIVGGSVADIKAFEGMIQTENDRTGPWCGATLIAEQWAVSAAHCVNAQLPGNGFQRVVLGRQNANGAGGESIQVDRVIPHEGYNGQTNENDIALLHLVTKATQKPVRLATAAEWPTLRAAGTPATVVGWGATSEGGQQSNTLLGVTIPIVGLNTCNQQYGGILDQRQVCAGLQQGGRDSCQGDSGGPLFVKQAGENIQIGVVSFGAGCARANFAGVYTAVAAFRPWIATRTNGGVPVEGPPVSTTPTPATTPDAGAPATPDSAEDEPTNEATEEVGAVPDSVSTAPTQTPDDDTASADDEDEDEDERPAKTTKKKSSKARTSSLGTSAATCAMGAPMPSGGPSYVAVLGLAMAVIAFRRRSS